MSARQDQARKVVNAARDVIESGWTGTQRVGQRTVDRAADAVDRALDGIFDEPYAVPDADTARQLIAESSTKRSSVVWSVIEGLALYRLTKWVARFSGFGVSSAVIAAAPAAVSGTRQAVERGLVQLRTLSSFLASRARAEGVHLDRALIRAATIETYLDPGRASALKYSGGRAGRAVATRWARDATGAGTDRAQRELANARVATIDQLDLRDLEQRWRAIRPEAADR
jgi:hypothetical protein